MLQKGFKWLVLAGFAALMAWGMWGLPDRGDLDAPMNEKTTITGGPTPAAHYIEKAYKEAKTPNIVTVVLGDYRSIDTLGEVVVVFTAGLILIVLLTNRRKVHDIDGGEQ
mgnify:FL=1